MVSVAGRDTTSCGPGQKKTRLRENKGRFVGEVVSGVCVMGVTCLE